MWLGCVGQGEELSHWVTVAREEGCVMLMVGTARRLTTCVADRGIK